VHALRSDRAHAELNGRSWTLFDVPIATAPPSDLLATISAWASERATHRVMRVDAHIINRAQKTPELATALRRADLVYGAGNGVWLAARALNGTAADRMTAADWLWGLAAVSELPGPSLYLLGSEPPIALDAAERLRRGDPQFDVVGAHHGCFDPASSHNERVIEDINERQPQIVLVGMGTPKQELWVDRYADRLGGAVVWTIGALFDEISGRDSGGTWRRCLVENSEFLLRVLAETRRTGR
jgi:N-acetylglucosaminyldiphosphoundecaprenol N-acetyl-beta-D-mannosaminyltransferase